MSAEDNVTAKVEALQQRLETLELDKRELLAELTQLKQSKLGSQANEEVGSSGVPVAVTATSNSAVKIALFRSLFRGREDIFPRRWQNARTGKSGYAPVCHNEWVRGICEKPRVKCGECPHQEFILVTDEVISSRATLRIPLECPLLLAMNGSHRHAARTSA